ncbi:hypothetical protein ERD78_18675 [Allopusillimonas soli]|uniref:Uncharacterized protein n=1 Tax=Allopusillimonas soli TaxID=659016 RepID=A0A853FGR8_9BURK|nr:hypothetical protein [Allopusillimonas soli]NYT38908.1 hypothetical protein [Allopusillimonas soli]TEA70094.1 hypothetical protein ERD78_18675 [Allopusillimonas soli]
MSLRAQSPVVWIQIRNILLRAPGDGWMSWEDLLEAIERRDIDTGGWPAGACAAAVQAGYIEKRGLAYRAVRGTGNTL